MAKMEKEISGKLTWYNRVFSDCDDDTGFYVDGNNLDRELNEMLDNFQDKKVKIKIAIEEEKYTTDFYKPVVNVRLSDIVKNDYLCNLLGYNPYCVSEGADGNESVTINLGDAVKARLVTL